MSPFSIAGATPTNAPLTVGDVIHQLPPEVVRMGALPAEQPLSLPPALLENALRSGQAALPVFELYRVCPALFQVPISPQDPRLVALPATKLPGLIAQAREGNASAPAAQQPSPFSLSQFTAAPGAPAASPFSLAQPAAAPAASPFSLAQPMAAPQSPAGSPFQMAAPSSEAAAPAPQTQASPLSAFATAAPGFGPTPFAAQPGASASPFSLSQPAPQQPEAQQSPVPAAGSPFSFGPSTGGSPFGMSSQPPAGAAAAAPAGSPFSMGSGSSGTPFGMPSQPAAAASPFSQAAAEPPFSSPAAPAQPQASISNLFTPQAQMRASTPSDMAPPPALPFGSPFVSAMKETAPQAEPPAQAAFAAPSPAPAPAAAPGNTGAASGMIKLGFAAVLSGYSMEELGFNSTTLPAWISTSVPASEVQEQMASGSIVLELGMLIDGISDVGFRNTLSNAKRSFRLKLPQNEVFHALTNAAAAPAAAAPRPAAQPATPNTFAMFTTAAAPGNAPAPQPGGADMNPNPFAQSQPAVTATPANGPMSFAFTPPAPLPALSAPPPTSSPTQFAFTPPAPTEPPKPQPAPVASSLFGGAQPSAAPAPLAPLQPMAGAFQAFGAQQPSAGGQAASAPLGASKPFDPFASSSTGPLQAKAPAESGFSSAQLLGQIPAPQQQVAPAFAPAPESKPAASFFAAPENKPAASLFAPTENKPAASLFAAPVPAPFQPTPSFAPALEEIPSFSQPAPQPQPTTRGLFSTQPTSKPLFAEPVAPQAKPEPKPAPAPAAPAAAVPATAPAKMAAVKHSFLGLAPLDTQTDQLLLRALLGTEEKLAAPRVVELLALQQGLSACVCLHGSHVLSHSDSSKPDAAEFQRQAPDIARQLRGLAPLIGIEGAETFTLNAGGRLLTFCFPGDTIIGVLHDDEPSTGMRDKITLIARELARMLG